MLSRRELLRTAPVAALAAGLHPRLASRAGAEPLIVRMNEPRNLETPLDHLFAGSDKFFVRSHFAVPEVDAKGFKLTVEGHVENKLELTLGDLKQMKPVMREMLLECAGNGRVFLTPAVPGLQWGHGGVGQAKWTGVPLGAILERAKLKAGAGDVVLIGTDKGTVLNSPGAIHFDRGIPLAKAKKDETMLVWEMGGESLSASHGGPLRALVGGWYGMASVKWLSRIVVRDRSHNGFWQTIDYAHWVRPNGGQPELVPVTAIQPKAVITSAGPGSVLQAGSVEVSGFAWAGENSVAKVEISTDGGNSWTPAKLGAQPRPLTAVPWSAGIKLQKGPTKLIARCTDDKGNTQPEKRDPDRRTYMINHLIPVEVTVK